MKEFTERFTRTDALCDMYENNSDKTGEDLIRTMCRDFNEQYFFDYKRTDFSEIIEFLKENELDGY